MDVTARDRDVYVMNTIDAALGLDRLVCKESYNEIVEKIRARDVCLFAVSSASPRIGRYT